MIAQVHRGCESILESDKFILTKGAKSLYSWCPCQSKVSICKYSKNLLMHQGRESFSHVWSNIWVQANMSTWHAWPLSLNPYMSASIQLRFQYVIS